MAAAAGRKTAILWFRKVSELRLRPPCLLPLSLDSWSLSPCPERLLPMPS